MSGQLQSCRKVGRTGTYGGKYGPLTEELSSMKKLYL